MEVLSTALIMASGVFLTFFVTWLWFKSKTVSKNLHDELWGNFNEIKTAMKVSEEKFQNEKARTEKLEVELTRKNERLDAMISANARQQNEMDNHALVIKQLHALVDDKEQANQQFQKHIRELETAFANINALYNTLKENFNREREITQIQQNQLNEITGKMNLLTAENSGLIANNSALTEKLNTQKEEITGLQHQARLAFENVANKILEEKTVRFTEANRINLESILKPLGENIEHFRKKVEETYQTEAKERFTLEKSVKELIEQTNKVSAEANNLATALKGQTKKQGDWGEMILESILEKSGLTRGREYTIQESMKDESGNTLRPDVIIQLPEDRKIIIDSKVSLTAFDRYCASENPDHQKATLKEHINSLYSHIDLLAPKRYDLMEGSLDFVMMFIPVEPAYLAAIQADPELWSYAYNKRILLISPTNLIAALKLVTDLWKREQQNRNALEIARQGEKLYEKIVGFVDTLEEIGKNIARAHDAYSKAVGQLRDGRGNLIGQALRLKNLGIKSDKTFHPNMVPLQEAAE